MSNKKDDATNTKIDRPWLFKPGQSGNPSGMPKGILTRAEIKGLLSRIWRMQVYDIEAILRNPTSTSGELLVAKAVLKALETGDYTTTEWFLQRSIGKVKDEVEVSTPRPFIAEYTDGRAEIMGQEEKPALEGEVVEPVPEKG